MTEESKDKKAKDCVVLIVKDTTSLLELRDIEVGEDTEMLLNEVNSFEATKESNKLLEFYIAGVQDLQKQLPLDSCTASTEKTSKVYIEGIYMASKTACTCH